MGKDIVFDAVEPAPEKPPLRFMGRKDPHLGCRLIGQRETAEKIRQTKRRVANG